MTHRPPRARLSLTLPIALAVCGPWAAAQALPDAGQLLREQVPRPERAAPELPRLQVPEPAPKPAATSGGVRFRVDTVVLQGHGAFTTDALLALVADLPGEQRTLADAEDAARRITAHYRARGYPVARAYVPAQDVTDGRLRIEVIEGRIDRVVLDNRSRLHDGAVALERDGLRSGDTIETAPIDRALQILIDTPGVGGARATLQPGDAVGSSRLDIALEPAPALSGVVGVDNFGSVYTRHAGSGKSLVLGSAVLNDGNGGGNYALMLVPQAGSRITAAPLQITADPAHKTFDGTTDARTTWRVSSGTLFGTDTVGDVGLRYDSAEVGVGKRLHLAGVALNDGNGGANYSVTLADNTGSSIRLSSVENARLEQVAANARSTVAPGAGSGPGFGSLVPRALSAGSAPIVLVDCGQRLPADLVVDDCR